MLGGLGIEDLSLSGTKDLFMLGVKAITNLDALSLARAV